MKVRKFNMNVPVRREDIPEETITKIEVEQSLDVLRDFENKTFFAPTRSEVEITTNNGMRYRADSIIINDDNTATAHRVYPLANFGYYADQTTAATDNSIIYSIPNTNTSTAFTDYLPAGFIEELKFRTFQTNFNYNAWPTIPVYPTVGMPSYFVSSARSKREQLQAKIRNQMQPDLSKLFGHNPRAANKSFRNTEANEMVALGLLKSMLEPSVWKKYLTHHFVTVQGPSGLTYQIQRKSHNIIVWDRGVKVSSLCVYLQDQSIPPTDEVVAKMLICMYDESDIWKRANVTWKMANGERIGQITNELGIPLPTTRSAFNFDTGANIYARNVRAA